MSLSKVIALFALFITLGSCGESAGNARRGYEPLDEVTVLIGEDGNAKLVEVITSFCKSEGIEPTLGNLYRHGQQVAQVTIQISEETFFYGDNFIVRDRFSMHAYSHESTQMWKARWSRLIDRFISEYGRDRVIVPR